jgi:Arc/MetJ family transcription regulator
MRTTIDIDDKILALAKKQALEEGTTLKKVVESALRQALFRSKASKTKFRLKWKTVRGKRIPGVDISDRDSLYEQMEGRA